MKANRQNILLLGLAALAMVSVSSCKDQEVYDTAVVREYNLTLDGKPFYNKTEDSHTYGDWNVYIYHSNGKLKGNYKTQYRFALENGNYKVLAFYSPTVARLFPEYLDLEDIYINQDEAAKTAFAVSDMLNYKAGEPLNLNIVSRTGLLRLRALDQKADKSYSQLRTTVSTPVKAYHPADGKVVTEGEPMQILRQTASNGGGIGFAEDIRLIGSEDHPVDVTIDYLDADGNVVKTKSFAAPIELNPNDTTTVEFSLNNPDEKVIMDYTVTLGTTRWDYVTEYPSVPVIIPDGFRYVEPADNLDGIIKELAADETVDHMKLFLKASSKYTISDKTLEMIAKPLTIVGQTPGYGQVQAELTFSSAMNIQGEISEVHFENLNIHAPNRMFNLAKTAFNLGEIAFVDCVFDNWGGVIWYPSPSADNVQKVGTIRLEGCRIINYTAAGNSLIGVASRPEPVSNYVFRNNVFHGKAYTTRTVVLSKLNKQKNDIDILVEGNTFIDTKGTEFIYFDIDGAAASSLKLTVHNNVISGSKSSGTWFKLGRTTSVDASGNTRTAGYEMKYGVEAPTEVTTTYNDLLTKLKL